MFALIVAGEAIFLLPFILIRVFKPIIREAFLVSDAQLGEVQAFYGITALISYFFGGFIADRWEARKLIAISIFCTALGGIWMMTIPSVFALKFLYGFWGVSTILLFWAALIKATRDWGDTHTQGISFGLLDGGRGAFAALIATFGSFIPLLFFPEDMSTVTHADKVVTMQYIIGFMTFIALLVAVFVWKAIPNSTHDSLSFPSNRESTHQKEMDSHVRENDTKTSVHFDARQVFSLLTKPKIIFHSLIIVCAYSAYKLTGTYATYAKDVWGFNLQEASYFGVTVQWMRPIAAITIGWIADKYMASKLSLVSFSLMTLASLILGFGWFEHQAIGFSMATFFMMVIGTYSLRGLYFAIIEEAKTPKNLTGTVVGIISVVGFTPDIFMSLLSGYMLGKNPTIVEYQNLFQLFALFPLVGLLATIGFRRMIKNF
ncbi:MFS transporter [Pseudotenacibaculum sp. MALMAid0570]|uniref:MFS transporter n=1 Tax=Pseudotenacibaculum sp. MALMAid0570 TaxID=3143938 RepID=UPI0032DFC97D